MVILICNKIKNYLQKLSHQKLSFLTEKSSD